MKIHTETCNIQWIPEVRPVNNGEREGLKKMIILAEFSSRGYTQHPQHKKFYHNLNIILVNVNPK